MAHGKVLLILFVLWANVAQQRGSKWKLVNHPQEKLTHFKALLVESTFLLILAQLSILIFMEACLRPM